MILPGGGRPITRAVLGSSLGMCSCKAEGTFQNAVLPRDFLSQD
jgi:hypothetical protein